MEFTNEDLLLGMQVLNKNTILALIKAVSVLWGESWNVLTGFDLINAICYLKQGY